MFSFLQFITRSWTHQCEGTRRSQSPVHWEWGTRRDQNLSVSSKFEWLWGDTETLQGSCTEESVSAFLLFSECPEVVVVEQSKPRRGGCFTTRSHLKPSAWRMSVEMFRGGVEKVTTGVCCKNCLARSWWNSKGCKAIASHSEGLSKGGGRVQEMSPVKGQGYKTSFSFFWRVSPKSQTSPQWKSHRWLSLWEVQEDEQAILMNVDWSLWSCSYFPLIKDFVSVTCDGCWEESLPSHADVPHEAFPVWSCSESVCRWLWILWLVKLCI